MSFTRLSSYFGVSSILVTSWRLVVLKKKFQAFSLKLSLIWWAARACCDSYSINVPMSMSHAVSCLQQKAAVSVQSRCFSILRSVETTVKGGAFHAMCSCLTSFTTIPSSLHGITELVCVFAPSISHLKYCAAPLRPIHCPVQTFAIMVSMRSFVRVVPIHPYATAELHKTRTAPMRHGIVANKDRFRLYTSAR